MDHLKAILKDLKPLFDAIDWEGIRRLALLQPLLPLCQGMSLYIHDEGVSVWQ